MMKVAHLGSDTLHCLNLVVHSFYVAIIPWAVKAVGDLNEPVSVGA